jgi:23S rRNA pseudouridine2457 synthase
MTEQPVIHHHYILNKPFGVISQFKTNVKKKLLGDLYPFVEGTMSIGRLDEDSEGLLLLSTDGKVSAEIRGKHIEKEYWAQVDGLMTAEALQQMTAGVEIGFKGVKYDTLPCKASVLDHIPDLWVRGRKIRDDRHGPTSWVSIIISEGKFRQVRKMTAAVGFPTLRLIRVRIGRLVLPDLKPGEVIEVPELHV